MDYGWRTLLIEKHCKVSYSNNNIIIAGEQGTQSFNIKELQAVIVVTQQCSITSKTITMLNENNVKLVFCDSKHNPVMETVAYSSNNYFPRRLKEQINWDSSGKDRLWKSITKQKIRNQAEVIKKISPDAYASLRRYADEVLDGDTTNREAQASRIYFNTLFGKTFNRRDDNDINAALNYGYAVLLSAINRLLAIYGYSASLGIHHRSCDNPFNLSCDILEPWRPIVDKTVYENRKRAFDSDYRIDLAKLLYSEIKYGNKKTNLISALEEYVNEVISAMNGEEGNIKEIEYAA